MPSWSEALIILALDPNSTIPLKQRLYASIRSAVIDRKVPTGTRLPPSRSLAKNLDISRTTVIEVYERLAADGLIRGSSGSGTYVADIAHGARDPRSSCPASEVRISARARRIVSAEPLGLPPPRILGAFHNGLPAADEFPGSIWAKHLARAARAPTVESLDYGDPLGFLPLRRAIAERLAVTRAVRCISEQVIIVDGTQHALDLIAQLLVDVDDRVCVEDPGYSGALRAYVAAGAQIVPGPVDDEGLVVAAARSREARPRIISVSPSHQYPCAISMSSRRRLELLAWAVEADAWIIEDDFENEFRYDGVPLASLQSRDIDDRVIYIGTFSKTMAPALRVGYIVVPFGLLPTFAAARRIGAQGAKLLEQSALCAFMESGEFGRHVRRMRDLYGERQAVLVEEVEKQLRGVVELRPASSGLHLFGRIVGALRDTAVSAAALAGGIVAGPVSRLTIESSRNGLLLGYAVANPQQIRAGVCTLARAFETAERNQ